ncbi:MAG: HDIG domain-containing protein [Phycisphaerales bacterium]|nr:HDIG domain-containing protein [Phycisphaerales bacterium]
MSEGGGTKGSRSAARRRLIRGLETRPRADLLRLVQSRAFVWGVVVVLASSVLGGVLVSSARRSPIVAVGQVMNKSRVSRVEFSIVDEAATERQRASAVERVPRVYAVDAALLEEIGASLRNLPRALSTVASLDDVAPDIRSQFSLTPEALAAVQREAVDGEATPAWLDRVGRLTEGLERRPVLDEQTWQRSAQEGLSRRIELRFGASSLLVDRDRAVNLADAAAMRAAMESIAKEAGFTDALAGLVVTRLLQSPRPTFQYDPSATTQRQNAAAAEVRPVHITIQRGQKIFDRGDVLSAEELRWHRAELAAFDASAERWRVIARRASEFTAAGAVVIMAAAYVVAFCPRIRRNPSRMAAIATLSIGALTISVLVATTEPWLIALATTAPTLFVAAILAIAYERRTALALGAMQAGLACIALDQPVGMLLAAAMGIGTGVWHLREVRHRNNIIGMSLWGALAMGLGVAIVGFIDRPTTLPALRQLAIDMGWAAAGPMIVGGIVLFILPVVERAFDIVTGMTLIELRDPKQPLLRRMQVRAPGTYNHSLNVASIAESAADAIGADGLLTYVGALYHDIGKMSKPEYFVENQSGGPNKHDKLSPAMSLLVIVGHVKDGVEMAREEGLPRTIIHFIEAHHGTTLVEYFYHRARQAAEDAGAKDGPEEIDYRYPGPKPQRKEVAIVMLADTVESATRSMSDPTPARIDQLVRTIANKRLLDGQFDECDLTLKELHAIVESISKTVASIYHGRIAYPGGTPKTQTKTQAGVPITAGGTASGTNG